MGQLIVSEFVTLDGVMQAPGGPEEDTEGGFKHGGWQAPLLDEESLSLITRDIGRMDALLLGRKTYDIFAAYWPKATTGEIADKLNNAPKFVASRSRRKLEWNNSTLIQGDLSKEGSVKSSVGQALPATGAVREDLDLRSRRPVTPNQLVGTRIRPRSKRPMNCPNWPDKVIERMKSPQAARPVAIEYQPYPRQAEAFKRYRPMMKIDTVAEKNVKRIGGLSFSTIFCLSPDESPCGSQRRRSRTERPRRIELYSRSRRSGRFLGR